MFDFHFTALTDAFMSSGDVRNIGIADAVFTSLLYPGNANCLLVSVQVTGMVYIIEHCALIGPHVNDNTGNYVFVRSRTFQELVRLIDSNFNTLVPIRSFLCRINEFS